jgi:hypothetical protein
MVLPRHPEDDDETATEQPRTAGAKIVIGLVVALIVVIVVLHLTGVIGGDIGRGVH